MKKSNKFLWGVAAVLLTFGFVLAGCDNGATDGGEDPALSGTITITPDTNVFIGMELTASYDGSETVTLTYQWKKDGANIGAHSNEYTPTEAGSYTVTINAAGYQSKTSVAVIVYDPDYGIPLSGTITITPDTNVPIGTELTASYDGSETVTLTYLWKKNGANIGAHSNEYTPTEAGSYTVTIHAAGYQSKTSAAVIVYGSGSEDTTFNSIAAFRTWLNAQPANTSAAPYIVKLNVNDIADLKTVLNANSNKYVYLDLSGSTITTIPNDAFYTSTSFNSPIIRCATLTGITIPDSVTLIGPYAFYRCTGLTSVTIPDSVTSIGDNAFRDCTGLTSVTIPNSVTSIGNNAFRDCTSTSLTSITIPDSVTYIGNYAFGGTNLKNITIKTNKVTNTETANWCHRFSANDLVVTFEDVTSIDDFAFRGCTSLTSITIPDSVTSIGNHAFRGCTRLTNVTIPDSVTLIRHYAFYDCTGLTSVTIGNSVTLIGPYAFYGCTGLTGVTIPDSVTTIGEYAFCNCTGLTSITIENGVTSIGNYAFSSTGLTGALTIPDSVNYLSGFYGCTGLTSITIPNSVTTIGDYAFCGCTGLTSITIPDSVIRIGNSAFSSTGLTSITIPNSVTTIGNYAFSISGLTSVIIGNSVTSIGTNAFYSTINLIKNITIKTNKVTNTGTANWGHRFSANGLVVTFEDVTSIDNSAFSNCTRLTSITISDSVTSIGDYAFSGVNLSSITIPDSVTSIGSSAFSNWTGLTSIAIPGSVTYIADNAFSGTTNLKNITIKTNKVTNTNSKNWGHIFPAYGLVVTFEDVTSIDNYAFSGCYRLTSVSIPDSVINIGNSAFGGCFGLTDITIPNGVISIGDHAFSNCTGLTDITIPNSVTYIEDHAFDYCTSLISVKFEGTIIQDNFYSNNPFPGDLRDKFYESDPTYGTPGTYRRLTSLTWLFVSS